MAETSFDAVAGSLNNKIYTDGSLTLVHEVTPSSNTPYTIPEDGLYKIHLSVGSTAAAGDMLVYANNEIFIDWVTMVQYGNISYFIPLKKGVVLTFTFVRDTNRANIYKCN